MNRFKKTLAGFGLALGLVALPLGAGAGTIEVETNHRIFAQEAVQRVPYEPMADYAMIERSPFEEIVGRDNLDRETILFLEDNIWDYEIVAWPEGTVDSNIGFYADDPPLGADWTEPYFEQQTGVGAINLDMFSEEIAWQDKVEDVAQFAQTDAENYYPSPDDVPQLRAGELNY